MACRVRRCMSVKTKRGFLQFLESSDRIISGSFRLPRNYNKMFYCANINLLLEIRNSLLQSIEILITRLCDKNTCIRIRLPELRNLSPSWVVRAGSAPRCVVRLFQALRLSRHN